MSGHIISALKTIAPFLLAFIALSLASVAMIRIGLRATPQADPFHAFGAMPPFTPEQLKRMARLRLEDPPNRSYATRRIDLIDSDEVSRDRPVRRLYSETYETPSAGLALRTDAGSVRPSIPPGPDAARLDPNELFESCWRRPRG